MEVPALVVAIVGLIVQVIQTWRGWNQREPPRRGRHRK